MGGPFARAFCRGKSPLCPCTGRRRAKGGPVVRARGRARQNRLRAALRARPRAGRWLGRPQGISLGGGRARTNRTPKTPRTVAGWACAPGHWPAQSHWASRPLRGLSMGRQRNAQDARCPSGPVPSAKRPSACLASGPPPRLRRSQSGGARSIDWDSRLPGGGIRASHAANIGATRLMDGG